MEYHDFLSKILDDGAEAARKNYEGRPDRLKGSLAGLEACRGKGPEKLAYLLKESRDRRRAAMKEGAPNYWELRCFEAEVEWACNCVSAMMVNCGMRPIVRPTARGTIKAAEVAGVGEVGGAPN